MKIQFCKELFVIARQKSVFRSEEYHPFEFDIDERVKKEEESIDLVSLSTESILIDLKE